jgi:nucleoporin NUP82
MDPHEDWGSVLNGHPIFNKDIDDNDKSLELSIRSLSRFTKVDPPQDEQSPSGRRQVMIIKDTDLILAVGKTIRMTSLTEARSGQRSYKVCSCTSSRVPQDSN